MARKIPEIRKQELTNIAMTQFINNGYEKTSIRSIVAEANGEIGMFYHHFASKEQIFDAVLQQYNTEYIERTKALINANKEAPLRDLFESLVSALENALSEYGRMNSQTINQQMLLMMHHSTLLQLVPIIGEVIQERSLRGEISPPINDSHKLAEFLLFGISTMIHEKNGENLEEKKQAIYQLTYRLLGVTTGY
jgi:AcrR family transcriptional regulator